MPDTLDYQPNLPEPDPDILGTVKAVSIIHFALGGLGFVPLIVLGPEMTASGIPGIEFLEALAFGGALFIFSGYLLTRRRWRLFSFAMSTMILPMVPLGTFLGGYSMFILCRREVRDLYA